MVSSIRLRALCSTTVLCVLQVYTTSNQMVRIYKVLWVSKESKAYGAEGRGHRAWYEGRPLHDAYPPALAPVLARKRDFAQLEDFNLKGKTAGGAGGGAAGAVAGEDVWEQAEFEEVGVDSLTRAVSCQHEDATYAPA